MHPEHLTLRFTDPSVDLRGHPLGKTRKRRDEVRQRTVNAEGPLTVSDETVDDHGRIPGAVKGEVPGQAGEPISDGCVIGREPKEPDLRMKQPPSGRRRGLDDRIIQIGEQELLRPRHGNPACLDKDGQPVRVAAKRLKQRNGARAAMAGVILLPVEEGKSERRRHRGNQVQSVGGPDSPAELIAFGRTQRFSEKDPVLWVKHRR